MSSSSSRVRASAVRGTVVRSAAAAALLTIVWPAAPAARAKVAIQLDYTYDTNGFFTDPARRAALEAAGQVFTDRFTDTLSAIQPSGSNTWTPNYFHPGTGANQTVSNPTISANMIRVYAGGRDFAGSTLGEGGPGGYSAGGTQAWFNTLKSRGEPGALANPATDFGPWGGSIAFDTVGPNWNFNVATGPASGQSDFLSVAVHELGHLLGVGTAGSWDARINASNQFTGPASTAVNGGTPPAVTTDGGHWASGTNSTVGGTPQAAAMTPSITVGTRKRFTVLDFAGMDDLGWDLAVGGDANADGSVDVADLGILATNYLLPSNHRWAAADFNYDGVVNVTDLGVLATNYGFVGTTNLTVSEPSGDGAFADALAAHPEVAAAAADAGLVPEPAGAALVGLAGLGLLRRRSRRTA